MFYRFVAAVLSAFVCIGCSGAPPAIPVPPASSERHAPAPVLPPTTEIGSQRRTAHRLVLDDEAIVRMAHHRFMVDVYATDGRVAGAYGRLGLAERVVMDPQLQRLRELADRYAATGQYAVSPGYESNVMWVAVDGNTAHVVDCSRDRGELFAADGTVLLVADDFFKPRQTELIRVGGEWLVREFYTGGDARCDPTDYR